MIDKTKPVAKLGIAFAAKLIEQKFDKTTLSELTEPEFADLNSMSANEIFDAILIWEGIMGYTDMIHSLHEQLWPASVDCRCPECGSLDIRKGDTEEDKAVCRKCGETLRLVYDLRRITRD